MTSDDISAAIEWVLDDDIDMTSFLAGFRDALGGKPAPDAADRRGPDYAAGRRAALAWLEGRAGESEAPE